MLRALILRDIVLVDRAEIAFGPGLNVLTGETGAGKSILLDALGFVLGGRGRMPLPRAGAGQGEVTAEFALGPDHPAREVLAAAGLPAGEELVLRRSVDAQGRSRAFANDARCGAETLRALGGTLAEIHGQTEDRGLLDPRTHRRFLDAFAGAGGAAEAVRAAWRRLGEARAALAAAEALRDGAARDAAFLRHAAAELAALAPRPGEEAALDALRRRMQGAERLRAEIARAAAAIGEEGAERAVAEAARRLAGIGARAEGLVDPALLALDRALDALGEAGRELVRALAALEEDPGALERAEERLFALRALARKHRVQPDDLPGLAADIAARLAAIEGGEAAVAARARDVAAAEAAWAAAAAALSALRREAARRLDAAMAAELPPLRLDRARFETRIAAAEPGPEGQDRVAFAVATHPGAEPGPIEAIASGGELARFLLALRVCLAADAAGLAMVFDEIDRGVGGATADAVGRRLAALARSGQVLVVTHSPQVAARGEHHFRIEKAVSEAGALTRVHALAAGERVEEIARMLAGERVTAAARAAAAALLAG